MEAPEIGRRLAQDKSIVVEGDIAILLNNPGILYSAKGAPAKSESACLEDLEIYKHLPARTP